MGFGQASNIVLGQPDMVSTAVNNTPGNPGAVSARSLNQPLAMTSDSGRLFLVDVSNNRVLIWNAIPSTNQQPADLVLGQPDMVSSLANNGGLSASSMNAPHGVSVCGPKLFVADDSNNRILVWNSIPTTNDQPADFVLGQPTMTSNTINNGGLSAHSLNAPSGVFCDGTRLYVADYSNNRVLVWNSLPNANNQSAQIVLGQPDFAHNGFNTGGISAATFHAPIRMYVKGQTLIVADIGNNRVSIWNSIPTTTGKAADIVLGQPNSTTSTTNTGGESASTMSAPQDVFYDGQSLYVTDWLNIRILIWINFPTITGQAADYVLGQPNMTSSTNNYGGISANSLSGPISIYTDRGTPGLIQNGGY